MDRRAYYTLVRMQQKEEKKSLPEWMVDDYRAMEQDVLFSLLEELEISLDRQSFLNLAQDVDSPEELTEELIDPAEEKRFDQAYLIVFEIWRRLLPEKLTLALFCDELDTQISLYNDGELDSFEGIENVLSHFEMVLEENQDQGQNPKVVFETIKEGCANDVESFLYEYIAEQVDLENTAYADDLIEVFQPVVTDTKWFRLLHFQIGVIGGDQEVMQQLPHLIELAKREDDIDFDMELLSALVQGGDQNSFDSLFRHALSLINIEEDFQDLLVIARDFYSCIDCEDKEILVSSILDKRALLSLESSVEREDPDIKFFF